MGISVGSGLATKVIARSRNEGYLYTLDNARISLRYSVSGFQQYGDAAQELNSFLSHG